MITDTTVKLPVSMTPEVFNPERGDIVVAEDGFAFLVCQTDYHTYKLIDIQDGCRWSDDDLSTALGNLEKHHGKLRIAKKASVDVEF